MGLIAAVLVLLAVAVMPWDPFILLLVLVFFGTQEWLWE